jgi:hypothetical protein
MPAPLLAHVACPKTDDELTSATTLVRHCGLSRYCLRLSSEMCGEVRAAMDIHKPKAAHSIREFLLEIGTIICGILIALGLEQVVQTIHQATEARETRENVRAEIINDISRITARASNQTCIDKRVEEINSLLDQARDKGSIIPPLSLGRPPRYVMESSRWDAASHSGKTSLLSGDEQAKYSLIYVSIAYFYEMENLEQATWAKLDAMENTPKLSPDGLLSMYVALKEERFYNKSLAQVGSYIAGLAHSMDLVPVARHEPPKSVCHSMSEPGIDYLDMKPKPAVG